MHRTRLAPVTTGISTARNTARLLTVALVAACVLLAFAPACEAAARRVTSQDLPSKSDVVRAFPGFKGLPVDRFPDKAMGHYAGVCSTWGQSRGRSGRVVSGDDFTTARSLRAQVVQFRSKARARAVFSTFRAFVRDCGQHWAGVDTFVQGVRMPAFGGQRIGYRTTEVFAPDKNLPSRHFLTVAVRKGKRVLVLSIQQPEPPKKSRFVRLARVAVAKMG